MAIGPGDDSNRPDFLDYPLGIWWAGLRMGLRSMRAEPALGIKRVVLPVGYWRSAEFAYVGRQLHLPEGARVLDVGSPKDLAAHLARFRRFEVVATDILESAIELSGRLATAGAIAGVGPGLVHSEVQDGRALPYPSGSFDGAFSVSVLEHIPEDGDTHAIAEIVRCVRVGARVAVTVPFAEEYRETFVNRGVYERDRTDDRPVFYERHYDDASLRRRLLEVPSTRVVDLRFWGEGEIAVERRLTRWKKLRSALSPLEPLLGALALKERTAGGAGRRMAAFFVLERVP